MIATRVKRNHPPLTVGLKPEEPKAKPAPEANGGAKPALPPLDAVRVPWDQQLAWLEAMQHRIPYGFEDVRTLLCPDLLVWFGSQSQHHHSTDLIFLYSDMAQELEATRKAKLVAEMQAETYRHDAELAQRDRGTKRSELIERNLDMEAQLAAARQRIADLEADVAARSATVDELRTTVDGWRNDPKSAMHQMNAAKEQAEALTQELREATRTRVLFEDRVAKQKHVIEETKAELAAMKAKHRRLGFELLVAKATLSDALLGPLFKETVAKAEEIANEIENEAAKG
jgi:hypothetical protein